LSCLRGYPVSKLDSELNVFGLVQDD